MGLATIICYCTNDFRFLSKNIQESLVFSSQVIVPVCDHFFDGSPENRNLLEWSYGLNQSCEFVEFPYCHQTVYPTYYQHKYKPEDEGWAHHWHSFARLIGFYHVRKEIEWILFLDADEIPDGKRMKEMVNQGILNDLDAARLLCYYYVLRPNFLASKLQELTLLVRKDKLEPYFFHEGDRYALFREVKEKKRVDLRGIDQLPLIHHYSWVRPEAECLKKAATWGHRNDRDWKEVIRDSFRKKGPLFGNDLDFEEINNIYFDPTNVPIPIEKAPKSSHGHVKRLEFRDYVFLEVQDLLALDDGF